MHQICKIQGINSESNADLKIKPDTFDETTFFYNEFSVSYDLYDSERQFQRSATSSVVVNVDEYLITTPSSEDATLETSGLGPCIGLILYHPTTKKTLMAHCYFDNPALEKSLEKMLQEFSTDNIDLEETQAILWGGNKENQASIDTATTLINGLKKSNTQLNTLCLFPQLIGYQFTPLSLFNCNTGVLAIDYLLFNYPELKKSEERLAALQRPTPVVKPMALSSKQLDQICGALINTFFGFKNNPSLSLEDQHKTNYIP
ncbi:hypothetical protein BN59_01064 [Legionella massiliensis]|uniref:Uncharacterized protein n=1 Tax=Legionella massiliensis TaxID=1034943 RepID=A0A078KYG0_9GAMM|nr:hypothetical protein [Legionella massiliensis]CDZ76788.1 hypothetical protein BN59_01064 [Legionella massiliensis]CEE12526.1 hypothetical protein BN1094_01064 [Legionella massiliensis]